MLAKPTALPATQHRTPHIVTVFAFICATLIAWFLHAIQSANTQIPAIILWPSLFLLSYIPAVFVPMFLSEKPQRLIQAFFLSGSAVWFLHPVNFTAFSPQIQIFADLLHSLIFYSEYYKPQDYVLLGLHSVAFFLTALSIRNLVLGFETNKASIQLAQPETVSLIDDGDNFEMDIDTLDEVAVSALTDTPVSPSSAPTADVALRATDISDIGAPQTASNLDSLVEISPSAAGFKPNGKAYSPIDNGYEQKLSADPVISAEWGYDDIPLYPFCFSDHLVFEHFDLPVADTEVSLDSDMEVFAPGLEQMGIVNALKRHQQLIHNSQAVSAFLHAYPDIPTKHAYLVRCTFIGANIPLKLFPSCIWEDTVEGRLRLFRQPVTKEGYPLGVAQSWPITDWNDF